MKSCKLLLPLTLSNNCHSRFGWSLSPPGAKQSDRSARQPGHLSAGLIIVWLSILLSACASAPLPFQLVSAEKVWRGVIQPNAQRIEVTMGDKRYQGFYILAASTAYSIGPPVMFSRWGAGYPSEMTTTVLSNSARATLSASSDPRENLFCQFILDGARALGECKDLSGHSYQMVAESSK